MFISGYIESSLRCIKRDVYIHNLLQIDFNIYRVSNRTKLAMGKTVDDVEQKLLKVVPKEFKLDVHRWLILHGRYVCTARKPKCGACMIEDLCEFKDKPE